jgi:hypothetical protein
MNPLCDPTRRFPTAGTLPAIPSWCQPFEGPPPKLMRSKPDTSLHHPYKYRLPGRQGILCARRRRRHWIERCRYLTSS